MTAATATAYTLADLKDCVMSLLLELAEHVRPDTYGCAACKKGVEDMCGDHGGEAAETARLERAAQQVRDAGTADEVEAAVLAATEGGKQ